MKVEEIPIAFAVGPDVLIGVIHKPERSLGQGVLSVVAGGPQYRGGCCRQLVYMARQLAEKGIPVMRFDYRGLGDSAGTYLGFENIEEDLRAALKIFSDTVPELKGVTLWGGCDAASAILINGWKYPIVKRMILGNPFARSQETQAAVIRQYYLSRLKDLSFWTKLLKLRVNPIKAVQPFFTRADSGKKKKPADTQASVSKTPFQSRMLEGLANFNGEILLVMSGRSLVSREFDELAKTSKNWQKAIDAARISRVDLPEADQAFSSVEARTSLIDSAEKWLLRPNNGN